jgi:hypothetical protein
MPEEIFDQDRPKSTMARRLDEAFAGCEEWTIAPPPSSRRADPDIAPWIARLSRPADRAAAPHPESRAA